jgi:nitroreductase
MDTIDAILTRRSVRKYTSEPLTDEQVETLLKAAMYAPSGGNRQPWHFVVIRSREALEGVAKFHEYASFLGQAQLGILVCAEEKLARPGRWIMDCAAATQNILLAAHALGLGACWIGIQPEPGRIEGFRALANLPEGVHPVSLVAVGHPGETHPQPQRFLPERIHLEKW